MTRLPYAGARLDTECVVALELAVELRERGARLQSAARTARAHTLARPKLRKRIAPEDAVRFIEILEQLAEVAEDPKAVPALRSADPDDDYLLALAARERAQLVSGDEHVLALATTLPISSPRAFRDELQRERPAT